jgi:hypothetical protein
MDWTSEVFHSVILALNVGNPGRNGRPLTMNPNAPVMSVMSETSQSGIEPYLAYELLGHIPDTALWRRKVNLKAKFATSSSYITFKG